MGTQIKGAVKLVSVKWALTVGTGIRPSPNLGSLHSLGLDDRAAKAEK